MRYYYKNKNSDRYEPHFIDNPVSWIVISLVLVLLLGYILITGKVVGKFFNNLFFGALIVLIAVSSFQLIDVKNHLGNLKRLLSYFVNYSLVQTISRNIIETQTTSSAVSKSYIKVPKIWLYYEDGNYYIKLHKIAGLEEKDLDRLGELIGSSLGEKYAVTSKSIDDGSKWFRFVCGRVGGSQALVPKTLKDLQVKPYDLKLMNNLTINMAKLPHLAIFGKTSSGKSTVLWLIILEHISNSTLYFLDGKSEFSILKSFYNSSNFAVEPREVINLLSRLIDELKKRKIIVNNAIMEQGKPGLTAYDLGLKPIYLFIDEYASILARFSTTKERKKCTDLLLQILMQSRAYGLYVCYCSQSPSTEVLSNQQRSQFGTYLLLGSANGETQRMAFSGQTATTGTVEPFTGYYLEEIASMPEPQKFWVPDIRKVNTLENLEKLYKKGEKNDVKI